MGVGLYQFFRSFPYPIVDPFSIFTEFYQFLIYPVAYSFRIIFRVKQVDIRAGVEGKADGDIRFFSEPPYWINDIQCVRFN